MAAGEQFSDLCKKKYSEQAVWFLNGFWNKGMKEEAENVWKFAQKFIELDASNSKDGNEIDEFLSHKFLETLDETMTVLEMRKKLREIDQDANGHMALLEYLVYRYGFGVDETVNAPQGGNQEEIDQAQAKFDELSEALTAQVQAVAELDAAVAELDAAVAELKTVVAELQEAVAATQAAVEELNAAVAELEAAEAKLQAAEDELQAAIDDLHAQEEAYHGAIATAEAKANDDTLGVVKRNRAAAELAQLKAEDPMPLRRAKLTQEASLRKVGKEKKIVAAKREEQEAKRTEQEAKQAEQEAKQAEMEAKQAEQEAKQVEMEAKKAEAEQGQVELEAKMEEASAELAALKAKGGIAEGVLWWMERTEIEADKYLPPSKQKYAHLHKKVDIRAGAEDE
ncbi:uncharacterized protein AMSG_07772 [Thecamonas trahens ATCC 50062]|uniref:Uncharacterized protein n=1 Tax=Thecamonas trahens ATCC 50062 TaxID=461836 RepID=A0A0L0DHX5_THETB|nr:hypothetical protein AMSG_07772 [Thecamonas trahens ATCC 50062]KNC51706.1 hypothetical protein AMSG_07772 [Thecamonas trahens ATCC 50062]|eukprot:XP_013755835.1 hypothetical protein AMSG_07772 [Thecamonas trahens ATCC 50062]